MPWAHMRPPATAGGPKQITLSRHYQTAEEARISAEKERRRKLAVQRYANAAAIAAPSHPLIQPDGTVGAGVMPGFEPAAVDTRTHAAMMWVEENWKLVAGGVAVVAAVLYFRKKR
jgi:hypothetical protein